MKTSILLFAFLASISLYAQNEVGNPVGKWRTIDDETGAEKSVVEFYIKDGQLFGKIDKIIDQDVPDPKCEKCPEEDDRYKQSVLGMEIIRGLEKDGEAWSDGTVLDPEKGKIYDCKVWLEDNETLKLRGYVAFFYRTQTWYRVK